MDLQDDIYILNRYLALWTGLYYRISLYRFSLYHVLFNILSFNSSISFTIHVQNSFIYLMYFCTYEFFIVYPMLIKINLKQSTICYESATFAQPVKWVHHIIVRTLHPFDIYNQILKIIHIIPIYLKYPTLSYIMNIIKSISLMYTKSSLFIVYCENT